MYERIQNISQIFFLRLQPERTQKNNLAKTKSESFFFVLFRDETSGEVQEFFRGSLCWWSYKLIHLRKLISATARMLNYTWSFGRVEIISYEPKKLPEHVIQFSRQSRKLQEDLLFCNFFIVTLTHVVWFVFLHLFGACIGSSCRSIIPLFMLHLLHPIYFPPLGASLHTCFTSSSSSIHCFFRYCFFIS